MTERLETALTDIIRQASGSSTEDAHKLNRRLVDIIVTAKKALQPEERA
jgi:hypothetical protein